MDMNFNLGTVPFQNGDSPVLKIGHTYLNFWIHIYLNMDKKGKFGFGFVLCLGIIFLILVIRLIIELAK